MLIQYPFPHLILEGQKVPTDWPVADHLDWVIYDSALERKRAFNKWTQIPRDCQQILSHLMLLPVGEMLGIKDLLVPDITLHGAGCHEMQAGDHLDLHLDCDRHVHFPGWQRRVNGILFVSDWQEDWGGELEFYQPNSSQPAVSILPARGKLVLFATGDESQHRVNKLRCPAEVSRRTLTVYWWGKAEGPLRRPRALFIPTPNEQPDPEKDQLRRLRAGV